MRHWIMPVVALAALALTGCTTTTHSTTARTAIEQALLTQSAEDSVNDMVFRNLEGVSYFILADDVEAYEKSYIMTTLNEGLLSSGMVAADSADDAEVLVYPRVANAAIDERSAFIGIPEFPLAIPGVGALALPEIVLYSSHRQMGRNRMGVYAKYSENDKLAFSTEMLANERYYTRWTVLFLFSFRTTNLDGTF